jgi:hypothetical protein
MSLPTDQFSLASYLILLVPGIVFTAVRGQLRGFRDVDRSVSSRILQAFLVSVIFDSIYIAIFGFALTQRLETGAPPSPTEVAVGSGLFFCIAIVIPSTVAWLIYGDAPMLRRPQSMFGRFRRGITNSRYESTPTAWDLATTQTTAQWVRVRIDKDVWVGGVFSNQSYFSTYPEPRDLFIERQYILDEAGQFLGPVEGTAGVWVAIQDNYVVEFLQPEEESENS